MQELDGVVAALAAVRPDVRHAARERLGAGLDHEAYRVGDLVVRLRRDPELDLAREAALLEVVASRCPVPVPRPVASDASWMAYPMLPGTPLLRCAEPVRAAHAPSIARALGAVLAALWSTPLDEVADVVEDDATPPEAWRDEAAETARELTSELPPGIGAEVERFATAAAPPPASRRVLCHNDLGAEHVLVDAETGRVTAVIDWSDAAIADPAKDLGLVLRDLGPGALDVAMRAAGARADLRPRALLYARCLALEDLAYGLETGDAAYARAARAALARLFTSQPSESAA